MEVVNWERTQTCLKCDAYANKKSIIHIPHLASLLKEINIRVRRKRKA